MDRKCKCGRELYDDETQCVACEAGRDPILTHLEDLMYQTGSLLRDMSWHVMVLNEARQKREDDRANVMVNDIKRGHERLKQQLDAIRTIEIAQKIMPNNLMQCNKCHLATPIESNYCIKCGAFIQD